MTTPSGESAVGALGPGGFAAWQAMTEADAKAIMSGGAKAKFSGAQNAFKTNGVPLSQQLEIINDHTAQIDELRAEFEQTTIWGTARTFTSNNTYLASPGTVRVEVVMVGAGGGGAMGKWFALNADQGGGSGGGGGENHFTIPGSLLFDSSGDPIPIPIIVGAGGEGGQVTENPGTGGGNTVIKDITAGGGVGGLFHTGMYSGGAGGTGMIPGGRGGTSYYTDGSTNFSPTAGGNSVSPYDLHGGGGGGGGGGSGSFFGGQGQFGGAGGVSSGGINAHWDGYPPSTLLTTGGGGGRGANTNSGGTAGHGAVPGGGGGGGGGANSAAGLAKGGNGGQGIIWLIERKA